MRHRGVDRLRLSRGRSVPEAVVRRADVRPALDHTARDVLAWLARVVALVRRGHSWVGRDAARARDLVGVAWDVPVRRPLPHVSRHVVEAVAVAWKRSDRRCAFVAVELQVLPRKLALPRVRLRFPIRNVLVTPGERRALESPACGVLPLRFARKLPPGPGGVRLRVLAGDVDDRMPVAPVDRRALSAGVLPVGVRNVLPPVSVVVQVHVDPLSSGRRERQGRAGRDRRPGTPPRRVAAPRP